MSSGVNITQGAYQIQGLNEAFAMMSDLVAKEKQLIIRGILRKVANQVVKPKLTEANIYRNSKKQPGKNPVVVTLDPNDPLGIKVGISSKFFYYRFTEFGTAERHTKLRALASRVRKSGKPSKAMVRITGNDARRGKGSGKQRIYPEIEKSLPDVIRWFNDNYRKETEKRMKALARRSKRMI